MSVLEVKNLCKKYPSFELKDLSFSLEKGKITGFIGRNGAGKSTTLKSLFNFVHPDNGKILFFNNNFLDNEYKIKQRVGFVSGGINYYSNKEIKTITNITKLFYDKWDDVAYFKYMDMFKLDENKTPAQLSAGMKVKYAISLALSHNAELLILDEPTSGLDPVSRDDLLDVFMELCDNGITILFSTHITSDLDKCADNIIYIKNGILLANSDIKSFIDSYRVLQLTKNQLTKNLRSKLIGCKKSKNGFSSLIKTDDTPHIGIDCINADLESIMIHLEREGD
ncbi:ABC transporter ATP-binding protein [Clostridium sp. LBM24168]